MNMFNKIVKDIKCLKIQGATNVAKAGLKALNYKSSSLSELRKAMNVLKKCRPTEPLLQNALNYIYEKVRDEKNLKKAVKETSKNFIELLKENQLKIVKYASNMVKKNSVIFTHCHSSTVTKSIIAAKRKNISVVNTETRPLYQGRITAKELSKAGIKTTMIVDSAMADFVHNADFVFVGADAITPQFFVNKVGTFNLAILAKGFDIPIYVLSDIMKFTRDVEIEFRDPKEVWDRPPKNLTILNPAFDAIPLEFISGLITQEGILTPKKFMKVVSSKYKYLFKF